MSSKFCWQFKTQRSFEPVLVIWVVLWLISSFFVNCCWQDGEYGNHDNARAVFAERSENFSLRFYSQYAFCVSFSSFSYRLSSSASSTSWSLCSSSCSPTYPTQCPRLLIHPHLHLHPDHLHLHLDHLHLHHHPGHPHLHEQPGQAGAHRPYYSVTNMETCDHHPLFAPIVRWSLPMHYSFLLNSPSLRSDLDQYRILSFCISCPCTSYCYYPSYSSSIRSAIDQYRTLHFIIETPHSSYFLYLYFLI